MHGSDVRYWTSALWLDTEIMRIAKALKKKRRCEHFLTKRETSGAEYCIPEALKKNIPNY